MANRAVDYADVRVKKSTLRIIQGFFKTEDPEEALDQLAQWLRERKSEDDLMRKYQGKGSFKKAYG